MSKSEQSRSRVEVSDGPEVRFLHSHGGTGLDRDRRLALRCIKQRSSLLGLEEPDEIEHSTDFEITGLAFDDRSGLPSEGDGAGEARPDNSQHRR
ncbi:MAG: hypothetical protein ABEK75_12795 [Salinibacter sp.]